MEEYVSLISGLGFPIFVALYFMIYMKKTIDNNTAAINELVTIMRERKGGD